MTTRRSIGEVLNFDINNERSIRMSEKKNKNEFPNEFPFWARMKISKNRTTLVIDEDKAYNKKKKRYEDGFVHRESIHLKDPNDKRTKKYEKIYPNPNRSDPEPMYLKKPTSTPKTLFKPHNKDLDMPQHLKERYSKNNKK